MGRGLFHLDGPFREAIELCSKHAKTVQGISLLEALYDEQHRYQLVHNPGLAQPALFALQFGLCAQWRAWGVSPSAVTGHSLGEYAAACAAGLLSLEDAIMLVVERGRLARTLPDAGLMAAVFADERTVRQEIGAHGGRVAVAALNAPQMTIVAGPRVATEDLLQAFDAKGIDTRPLQISHALHCSCVDPILDELERIAAKASTNAPFLPLVSTLEGRALDPGEIPGSDYWKRHARQPVRFMDVVRSLESEGYLLFLEVGPHSTLVGAGKRCLLRDEAKWLPSLRRSRDDLSMIADTAMRLWLQGVEVNLERLAQDRGWRYLTAPAPSASGVMPGVAVGPHAGTVT
jgi:acyl transferase domain-containing protein